MNSSKERTPFPSPPKVKFQIGQIVLTGIVFLEENKKLCQREKKTLNIIFPLSKFTKLCQKKNFAQEPEQDSLHHSLFSYLLTLHITIHTSKKYMTNFGRFHKLKPPPQNTYNLMFLDHCSLFSFYPHSILKAQGICSLKNR